MCSSMPRRRAESRPMLPPRRAASTHPMTCCCGRGRAPRRDGPARVRLRRHAADDARPRRLRKRHGARVAALDALDGQRRVAAGPHARRDRTRSRAAGVARRQMRMHSDGGGERAVRHATACCCRGMDTGHTARRAVVSRHSRHLTGVTPDKTPKPPPPWGGGCLPPLRPVTPDLAPCSFFFSFLFLFLCVARPPPASPCSHCCPALPAFSFILNICASLALPASCATCSCAALLVASCVKKCNQAKETEGFEKQKKQENAQSSAQAEQRQEIERGI